MIHKRRCVTDSFQTNNWQNQSTGTISRSVQKLCFCYFSLIGKPIWLVMTESVYSLDVGRRRRRERREDPEGTEMVAIVSVSPSYHHGRHFFFSSSSSSLHYNVKIKKKKQLYNSKSIDSSGYNLIVEMLLFFFLKTEKIYIYFLCLSLFICFTRVHNDVLLVFLPPFLWSARARARAPSSGAAIGIRELPDFVV